MSLHVLDLGPLGPVVAIGVSVGFHFGSQGFGGPPGTYNGLIDTGSMQTAISPLVRSFVQPRLIGQFSVNCPGQTHAVVPSFDVRQKFEGHLTQNPWLDLEALLIQPATPGIDVIIGQDVLSRLSLVYNGPLGKLVVMY